MFNVLTDAFKEQIKARYKKRKILIWLMAIVFLQISFLIFTVPSYLYLVSDQKDLIAQQAGQNQNGTTSTSTDIAKIFHTTNNKLAALSSSSQSNNLDTLVADIISLKGSSVQLDQITYNKDTATSSTFTLQGVALDRDSLLLFSKKLEADAVFQNVNLPVSNFAKDKDINFSMTVNAMI